MRYWSFLFFIIPILFIAQNNNRVDSLQYIIKTTNQLSTLVISLNSLSSQLCQQGDYEKSMQYANEVVSTLNHYNHYSLNENFRKKQLAIAYTNIGNAYKNKNDYDKSLEFYTRAINIYEQLKDTVEMAKVYNNIGIIYYNKSDYNKALDTYIKSLKIFENAGDRKGQADCYNNIGLIYNKKGEYDKSLEFYFKNLKIREEIKDKSGIAASYNNIGNIYYNKDDYNKALEYYLKSLKIKEEIGDKKGLSHLYNNIGLIYTDKENYDTALEYHFRSLKVKEEIGDKKGIAYSYSNIGIIYTNKGEYENALKYHLQGLKIKEELDDKKGIAFSCNHIGYLFFLQKKYKLAKDYLNKGLILATSIGVKDIIMDSYLVLSKIDSALGDWESAYKHYKSHSQIRHSVLNEKTSEKIADIQARYESEKKEQQIKLLQYEKEKQRILAEQKNRKQQLMLWYLFAGLLVVLLFTGFILRSLRITRKQKQIIELQKQLVEQQKKLVEAKNKEIIDSIVYAKRIQTAILPGINKWKKLLPHSFVLYLPKDIVDGDFYWLEETDFYIYVAVADCTGHGVPGAMVSVICSNALTKAVLEEKITDTNAILNRAREIVIEKLSAGEEQIQDGMDICLVRIKKGTRIIQYSGANRPLYIIQNEKIYELKPDKQPVGLYERYYPFSKQEITLSAGSKIYLTTDGYADQFGGEKGKKLGTRKFIEKIIEFSKYKITEQEHKLLEFYNQWKGNNFQIDDVTIIGIEL